MRHIRLLVVHLMVLGLVACGVLTADESGRMTAEPAFENVIRLPQDLYTREGQPLQGGSYRVRVRFDDGRPTLIFEGADRAKTVIEGRRADRIQEDAPGIPIAGTMFLRSTHDPVGADAERHHSKTGHPQYQERERDWKATLRMYRHADAKRRTSCSSFKDGYPAGAGNQPSSGFNRRNRNLLVHGCGLLDGCVQRRHKLAGE